MKKLNEDSLVDAIGEIDEKYIRESERRSVFAPAIKYSSAAAACLAFVLITGVALYSASKREDPTPPPVIVYTTADSSSVGDTTVSESTSVMTECRSDVTDMTDEMTDETFTETESETVPTPIIPDPPMPTEPTDETFTETESETVPTPIIPDPPMPTEPTEPAVPTEEPEESTTPRQSDGPATDTVTEDLPETPVSPSDPIVSEPAVSTNVPDTGSHSTEAQGTGIVIVTDDTSAALGTTATSGHFCTSSDDTGSYDTDPPKNEYEKYYTETASTKGSSSGVKAHYLSKIPDYACIAKKTGNSDAETVFNGASDIFVGRFSALSSVEVEMDDKYFYMTVLEVKLTDDIFRNSGYLSANKTVRILLPHGVNATDEGLYDADDIAGFLGEWDMLEYGSGVFCVDRITNERLTDGTSYYPLSNIADYILTDGMNDLILSNSYFTFYNEKTYAELDAAYRSDPTMAEVIEYFNKAKNDGLI